MSEAVNKKQGEVRDFWNSKPCDSELSEQNPEDKTFYSEIEAERYRHQHHIPGILNDVAWTGKDVLEIGTGVGTDARQIIARGGNYTGINVDAGSVQSTQQALDLFGLPGRVYQQSATDMSFENNSFDIVYSFGVLHHIPEVEKAIREIHRVLKPGGKLVIMLYNRRSINYQIEIRYLRRIGLKLLTVPGVIPLFGALGFPQEKLQRHAELYRQYGQLDAQEWLNRNTDGPDNPYSKVYDQKEVEDTLKGFSVVTTQIHYFEPRHWGPIGRLMPARLVQYLGARWGWHRTVFAEKV